MEEVPQQCQILLDEGSVALQHSILVAQSHQSQHLHGGKSKASMHAKNATMHVVDYNAMALIVTCELHGKCTSKEEHYSTLHGQANLARSTTTDCSVILELQYLLQQICILCGHPANAQAWHTESF